MVSICCICIGIYVIVEIYWNQVPILGGKRYNSESKTKAELKPGLLRLKITERKGNLNAKHRFLPVGVTAE